jgi:uncharacterized membrane protein YeaQ/YmgE (transglycosylase-associated protein family)
VSWQGAFALYDGEGGTTASSTIVYEIEPGKRLGWHTDATEETQYIIAGQGKLYLDHRRLMLDLKTANSAQRGGTMLEALIVALVVGGIAGWLAGLLVQGTGFGLVGDIVVGILGALLAGFLFPALGIALTLGGGLLGAILTAFLGAVILLLIVGVIKQVAA